MQRSFYISQWWSQLWDLVLAAWKVELFQREMFWLCCLTLRTSVCCHEIKKRKKCAMSGSEVCELQWNGMYCAVNEWNVTCLYLHMKFNQIPMMISQSWEMNEQKIQPSLFSHTISFQCFAPKHAFPCLVNHRGDVFLPGKDLYIHTYIKQIT